MVAGDVAAAEGVGGEQESQELSKGLLFMGMTISEKILAAHAGKTVSDGRVFRARPLPPFVMEIVQAGGLIEFTQRRLARRAQ